MIDIRKWNESAQSTQPQPNSTSCEQDKNERLCFWQKKTRLCRQRGSLSPCDSLNLPKTNRSQLPLDRAGRPRPALARPRGRAAGKGASPTRLAGLPIVTRYTTIESAPRNLGALYARRGLLGNAIPSTA